LIETAKPIARQAHEADPDMVLQAACFEIVTTSVGKLPVPEWLFREPGFTAMWWTEGPPHFLSMKGAPPPPVLCLRSGEIGRLIDTKSVRLPHAGRFAAKQAKDPALEAGTKPFREALTTSADTWQLVQREAAGNALHVDSRRGTVTRTFPLVLAMKTIIRPSWLCALLASLALGNAWSAGPRVERADRRQLPGARHGQRAEIPGSGARGFRQGQVAREAPCAKSNCYPGTGIVVPKGCYPMALVFG
jgi:hypothetical protein